MHKISLLLCAALFSFGLWAQDIAPYDYKVNLNKVEDDKLTVELSVPAFNEQELTFHMPAMVPGTYSIYDFGRFVSDFKAFDHEGKELSTNKSDDNTWVISNAKNIGRITYKVEDTWDTKKKNVVFEPAGTNFDKDNVFVFNNHGIFGFFKGKEYHPIALTVIRPSIFFGGTSLQRATRTDTSDVFVASSYHELVDSPIMFAPADTAHIKVGNCDVLIHTFSPTGKVKSKDLVADIQPTLEAQRQYLGGTLPVDRYAFIIFLNKAGKMYLSGAAGALEHSYSSFYCLFEGDPEKIAQQVRDVAAHEFFHIVTPLSIHSEEIHYFDFIDPKMSEHLWLYEGVTEYSAQHVQVKHAMVDVAHFLKQMSDKMAVAERFNQDLSFTEMSKTCLDENKDQYYNVYQKGALIGMCIDLKLLSLSDGKYGIQELMRDLAKKYGIKKPFKDAELFDEMAAVSGYPQIKEFMLKHVAGTSPLPIAELVASAGIEYNSDGMAEELSILGFDPMTGLTFDFKKGLLKITKASAIDDFGKSVLGLREGDLLKKWDGQELNIANVQNILGEYSEKVEEGYVLRITVLREAELSAKEKKKRDKLLKKGKTVEDIPMVEKELSGKLQFISVPQRHSLKVLPNPNETQLRIRKAWLGEGAK